METRNYWEENGHSVKYDNYNSNDGFAPTAPGELNFATVPSDDEAEFPPGAFLKKGKVSRQDPMSHRIIEKRRRDRMNNCLADLSRLIPPEYLKKGRGRVEKTEIIEMAIRHLKYLQERVNGLYSGTNRHYNVAERKGEEFRAGYKEAAAEAVHYLVDAHGYQRNEGLCTQLTAHLQRHCDHITKGDVAMLRQNQKDVRSLAGSSSETASSSSSSLYKPSVLASSLPPAPPPLYADNYEQDHQDQTYQPMDCDRVPMKSLTSIPAEEPMGEAESMLDERREPTLRAVRKPEHAEDYIHSYKFKNSIERRFSRSQDFEAAEVIARNPSAHPHGKMYTHKRRRAAKPAPSTSTSNSGSTEETRDTSPQDTSSESPQHHHHYEKPAPPSSQYVPVFALNAVGKYYVPLSVEYSCLSRHLGPYDIMEAHSPHMAVPLHPITIHVNFQQCLNYHIKREPLEREWRPE